MLTQTETRVFVDILPFDMTNDKIRILNLVVTTHFSQSKNTKWSGRDIKKGSTLQSKIPEHKIVNCQELLRD